MRQPRAEDAPLQVALLSIAPAAQLRALAIVCRALHALPPAQFSDARRQRLQAAVLAHRAVLCPNLLLCGNAQVLIVQYVVRLRPKGVLPLLELAQVQLRAPKRELEALALHVERGFDGE